jgi:hypothetical protein
MVALIPMVVYKKMEMKNLVADVHENIVDVDHYYSL